MTKLTPQQKLAKAIHVLKIYGNIDFWQYKNVINETIRPKPKDCRSNCKPCRKVDPVYTSLEVKDKKGLVKNGWEWAKEILKEIE